MFMINRIISTNNQNQTFRGRLFFPDMRQIKSFDAFDILAKKDMMAERGAKATTIYIKDFISKKQVQFYGYANSIRLALKNPLFGTQEFVQKLSHETNSPVKGDFGSELWHSQLLTNNTEHLEDRALRGALIDSIKKLNNSGHKKNLNPVNILEDMLKKTSKEEHGFSDNRINDFKNIANDLISELISKGVNHV